LTGLKPSLFDPFAQQARGEGSAVEKIDPEGSACLSGSIRLAGTSVPFETHP